MTERDIMMSRFKYFCVFTLCVLIAFFIVAYFQFNDSKAPIQRIHIGGSTTLYSAFLAEANAFNKQHKNAIAINSQSSTGEGIDKLIRGELQIARGTKSITFSDIRKAKKAKKGLHIFQIDFDALAIIVHPSKYKKIKNITKNQLYNIFYTGKIHNWSQLNSALKGPIHVYVRDPNVSGTAATFNKLITGKPKTRYISKAIRLKITTEIIPTISNDKDGISVVGTSFINPGVKALAYGTKKGATYKPTVEEIINNEYKLARSAYIFSTQTKGAVGEFISFVLSPHGQKILKEYGFIPIDVFQLEIKGKQ